MHTIFSWINYGTVINRIFVILTRDCTNKLARIKILKFFITYTSWHVWFGSHCQNPIWVSGSKPHFPKLKSEPDELSIAAKTGGSSISSSHRPRSPSQSHAPAELHAHRRTLKRENLPIDPNSYHQLVLKLKVGVKRYGFQACGFQVLQSFGKKNDFHTCYNFFILLCTFVQNSTSLSVQWLTRIVLL